MTFAERINPRKFNFSPRMTALVGAIIGYDYGVKDVRGNTLRSILITSDGFILGNGSQSFIGSADDLVSNLRLFKSLISKADGKRFDALYSKRVIDWRTR
jgi:hypothetical protein